VPLRTCLDCGTITTGNRCPSHRRAQGHAALSTKRDRRPYTSAERTRRAAAVTAWVNANGWVCPGWHRDPHPSRDLTADHTLAVAAGGSEDGPLGVLCRSCNSRKNNRT